MRRAEHVVAGRYELLGLVGAGAMGTVHRAWDRREHRHVAVKVLRASRGDPAHDELLLRFVREQSLRIEHPHVLAPHGWAADDDAVLLVTDLVTGGSLDGLLARGRLPAPYVAELLRQLLAALAAVHAAGVVHRDVKPANVLLEPTGRGRPHLRLADLGVAALARDRRDAGVRLTRVPGAIGTVGYLAPECAAGAEPHPGQDLYAAGVLARRCLRPDADPRRDALDTLIALLADPDPSRRPASAAAALAALPADPSWYPTTAPDVTDVLTPTGPVPRPLLATACLTGSAVLSVAAGVVAAWP